MHRIQKGAEIHFMPSELAVRHRDNCCIEFFSGEFVHDVYAIDILYCFAACPRVIDGKT